MTLTERTIEQRAARRRHGAVLVVIVVVMAVLMLVGVGVLALGHSEAVVTRQEIDRLKAFYLAEAGVARLRAKFHEGDFTGIEETPLGDGVYQVDYVDDANEPYAIATGRVGTLSERIRIEPTFLAAVYEHAMYAGNGNDTPFVFTLRGRGDPVRSRYGEVGGRDRIDGNVFVNGDVRLYEQSQINAAPWPNPYGLEGDVEATGVIDTFEEASIAGREVEHAPLYPAPDLRAMDYANNNTYDVGRIFNEQGIQFGRLSDSHELADVVVKNPVDRSAECASTPGDDFFLEPSVIYGAGDQWSATTPLHLGKERVYYFDGDVWIHSFSTYGFLVDGEATIVATGDIHICDNLAYADDQSLLGLVALGRYSGDSPVPDSGGNIYFGDPRFGTTYTVSALMVAANDFLYNTDSVTQGMQEPTSGFTVTGNYAALNHISIERDWYTRVEGRQRLARPAHFDTDTNTWVDLETGDPLTSAEIDSLRHYQMKVFYDDRVRSIDTQPPGLPQGRGRIFAGFSGWREVP